MAAEITLFSRIGKGTTHSEQVASTPIASHTATFTTTQEAIIRVYANGAPVSMTVNGITWTVPIASVEYFGAPAGQLVTIA